MKTNALFLWIVLLACSVAESAKAQSSDQSLPTPILSNQINGNIRALDLGDPRLTRHFYAFEATPGDLLITVNSRNLNGDVDVFTAITFRPLTKITIYANTIPPEVTKSIYFRTRQILILRVEARTPNDDAGEYRITFGGTFQPFSGGIPVAENSESTSDIGQPADRKANQLSSVGATIERPPVEIKPTETGTEKPPEETAPVKKPTRTATRTTSARNSRRRVPRTASAKPPSTKTEVPKETPKADTTEAKPSTPREGEEKSGEKPSTITKPTTQETLPPPGAHLIIEEKDGTKIDRPMSTVRRVIVDSGFILIILKSGRTERVPMSNVTRMAIEPQ